MGAGSSTVCSVTTWRSGMRGEVQEGGATWVLMADACCCIAGTNTILESNYLPIKV